VEAVKSTRTATAGSRRNIGGARLQNSSRFQVLGSTFYV
jgi:hypothetical protein